MPTQIIRQRFKRNIAAALFAKQDIVRKKRRAVVSSLHLTIADANKFMARIIMRIFTPPQYLQCVSRNSISWRKSIAKLEKTQASASARDSKTMEQRWKSFACQRFRFLSLRSYFRQGLTIHFGQTLLEFNPVIENPVAWLSRGQLPDLASAYDLVEFVTKMLKEILDVLAVALDQRL